MSRQRFLKASLICGWLVGGVLLMTVSSSSQQKQPAPSAAAAPAPQPNQGGTKDGPGRQPPASAEYVGAETCQSCHETQAAHFLKTTHSRIGREASWKGKVTGCEACHG